MENPLRILFKVSNPSKSILYNYIVFCGSSKHQQFYSLHCSVTNSIIPLYHTQILPLYMLHDVKSSEQVSLQGQFLSSKVTKIDITEHAGVPPMYSREGV